MPLLTLSTFRQLAKLPSSQRLRGGACCDPASDADNVSLKLRDGDLVILFVRRSQISLCNIVLQESWRPTAYQTTSSPQNSSRYAPSSRDSTNKRLQPKHKRSRKDRRKARCASFCYLL